MEVELTVLANGFDQERETKGSKIILSVHMYTKNFKLYIFEKEPII